MSGANSSPTQTPAATPPPAGGAAAPGAAPAGAPAGAPAAAAAGTPPAGGANAPAPAPAGAPAALDLKFPDGFAPDAKQVEQLKAIAAEHKLDGAAAQKFADFWVQSQQASHQAAVSRAEAAVASWQETAKTDKELSAPGFKELAKQGMLKFATPELAEFFNKTGLGEHPEFIRVFGRLAKLNAEDTLAGGGAAPAGSGSDEAFLTQMYDHPTSKAMFKKE